MEQLTNGLDEKSASFLFSAQLKEQGVFMNTVTEKCFEDCVISFRNKDLSERETTCINRCADKYFALSQVLGSKYWEEQQKFMENQNQNQYGGGFGGPTGGNVNNGFGNFGGSSMAPNFGGPTFNPNQRFGMIAPCLPGHDPMIQRLEIQEMANIDGVPMAKIYANIDHVGCIMGHGGMRIKEIRRLSGASITIVDPTGDRCLREITIAPNPKAPNSGMQSIPFAIWLMNVAINAFADVSASLCPFGLETSLQDVVTTGAYGQPDMGQNQDFSGQQQQEQQEVEQNNTFGGPPVGLTENAEVQEGGQEEDKGEQETDKAGEQEPEVVEEVKEEPQVE